MLQHFKVYILFALLLPAHEGTSQPSGRTITGIITSAEDATPLEGVSVFIKGSNRSSGTQADGTYYITISPADSIIVFSYTDFQTKEIKLDNSNEYDVALTKTGKVSEAVSSFSPFGKWRGIFRLKDSLEVPFIFEIDGTNSENAKVYFINAEEKFEAGTLKQTKDSLLIFINQFENELAFKKENNLLSGVLRRQDRTGQPIPVKAESGVSERFLSTTSNPAANINGTYDIYFKNKDGKDENAVGLFKQEGHKLRATFLRITGDSRYLDGIVNGSDFYLSTFIGSVPGYYKGSIDKDGTITGEIISARGSQKFSGVQNEEAALPDLYKLTYLKEGYSTLDFSFPDINGKSISLKDEKYKNKVVILTITGSWCPNCIDEAAFLAPWYKANKKRGVESIAIHYERKTDSAYVRKAITKFRERFGIEYDAVFAGLADKQHVAESLPALNTFLSFPTTIFIDKKGKVTKIHTGYTGPATGKYYEEFVKEFNKEVDDLLKQ